MFLNEEVRLKMRRRGCKHVSLLHIIIPFQCLLRTRSWNRGGGGLTAVLGKIRNGSRGQSSNFEVIVLHRSSFTSVLPFSSPPKRCLAPLVFLTSASLFLQREQGGQRVRSRPQSVTL